MSPGTTATLTARGARAQLAAALGVVLAAACCGCGGSSSDDDDGQDICARLSINDASGVVAVSGCAGNAQMTDVLYNGLGQLASYSFALECGAEQHTGRVTRIDWQDNRVTCFDATVDGRSCPSCAPLADAGPPDAPPPHDECAAIDLASFPIAVAWSPDGSRLAGALSDNGPRVWQLPAGTELTELDSLAWDVAFSPDGATLATAEQFDTIELWDASSFGSVGSLTGHIDIVTSVAWAANGTRVASGSWDHTARLWDVATRSEVRLFAAHTDWVNAVALSPDGSRLATASQDETVIVWDAETAEIVWMKTPDPGYGLVDVAFSPDGSLVATGGGSVQLFDAADGAFVRTVTDAGDGLHVAFFPDGAQLATAAYSWSSGGPTVDVWRVSDGALQQTLRGHTQGIYDVAVAPDGTRLATAGEDYAVRIWCLASR